MFHKQKSKWDQSLETLEEREYQKALKEEKLKKWKSDLSKSKARARERAKAKINKKKRTIRGTIKKIKSLDKELQYIVHGKPKKRRKTVKRKTTKKKPVKRTTKRKTVKRKPVRKRTTRKRTKRKRRR